MRISRSPVRILVSLSTAAVALLLVSGGALVAQEGPDCAVKPWSYRPPTGPAQWPSLSCCSRCGGRQQSPINITNAIRQPLLPLGFSYGTVPVHVVHTGYDIRAILPSDVPGNQRKLRIHGVDYIMDNFHFHTRSEHTLNGSDWPIEMHIVHKRPGPNGKTVAVAVFIEPGPENQQLSKIWANLPTMRCDRRNIAHFDLQELLPQSRASYRYAGSLTTPACDQGVDFIVLATPITMRPEQIQAFEHVFSSPAFPEGNRRPTQTLHGRQVVTDVPRKR